MRGIPTPTDCWAKLERCPDPNAPDGRERVVAWHPLVDHCVDVAACAEALLRDTLLGRRLARLMGLEAFTPVQLARLCVLVLIHDAGKCNRGFQDRARGGPTIGHVGPLVHLLAPHLSEELARLQGRLRGALEHEALTAWFEAPPVVAAAATPASWFVSAPSAVAGPEAIDDWLLASFGHHGCPVRPQGEKADEVAAYWSALGGQNPLKAVETLFDMARVMFPNAFASDATNDAFPYPKNPQASHAFNGLVHLADWLGSDVALFPFRDDAQPPGGRPEFAREAAARALREIGIDPREARAALTARPVDFSRISPHPPRPLQRLALEAPLDPDPARPGGVLVLESDTGSGKTEAALGRFVALLAAGSVDGLYFALPTRSAASQLFGRVCEAVTRAFGPDHAPPVTLAVPGYLSVGVGGQRLEGRRLAPFDVLWPDPDDPSAPLPRRHRAWAGEHPKRYLAAPIAVGTIDQVLLSTLQTRHAQMRATALSRALLVVDEVHASDAYMTTLLQAVLDHHLAAGGHALLMSATLGRATLDRLTTSARQPPHTPLDRAVATPYPCVHWTDAARAQPLTTVPVPLTAAQTYTKAVYPTLAPAPDDAEALTRLALDALDAAQRGARVLVLRNTVADCVATQRALEAAAAADPQRARLLLALDGTGARDPIPVPHHARFAPSDRRLLDACIERAFGKTAAGAGAARGVVAVTTQTVEQSLDLDADLLITDLCPMDVMLQRWGRLHRHPQRARPPGFERACVRVLTPRDLDQLAQTIVLHGEERGLAFGPHGWGTVYANLLVLVATERLLRASASLTIPDANRHLVEHATHPDALRQLADALGPPWVEHLQTRDGRTLADRIIGKQSVLERAKRIREATFAPDRDLHLQIATRLGERDRIARWPEAPTGPFGAPVDHLRIPHASAKPIPEALDAPDPARPLDVPGFTFAFGPVAFRYTRLGLESAPS